MAIENLQAEDSKNRQQGCAGVGGEGLRQYYQQRIQDLQLHVRQKTHDLQRLEAQRNDLNGRGLSSISLPLQEFSNFRNMRVYSSRIRL